MDRYGTFNGADFKLKNKDKLVGSGSIETQWGRRDLYYTLKRVIKDILFEAKELIGAWHSKQDNKKWHLLITEINQQEKKYNGKLIITDGGNKGEYDISSGKLIEDEGKVSIEGKALNNAISFALIGYSKFADMPPALWGKVDGEIDGVAGTVHDSLFEKKLPNSIGTLPIFLGH